MGFDSRTKQAPDASVLQQGRSGGESAGPSSHSFVGSNRRIAAAGGDTLEPHLQGWMRRGQVDRRQGHQLSALASASGASGQGGALNTVGAMAPLVGVNPSAVAVRLDAHSTRAAASRSAHALQSGNQILLREDRFDPSASRSRQTVAHELIHVAQRSRPAPESGSSAALLARAEAQAHTLAPQVARGASIREPLVHLPASLVAADGENDHPTAPAAAPATQEDVEHNLSLGLGPDAVSQLRTAVGLPRRGTLDLAFAEALQLAQPTRGSARLSWEVVRTLSILTRPSDVTQARRWYGERAGFWARMDAAARNRALETSRTALEVDTTDAEWQTPERGPARMNVTPLFVQRAAAWQLWQRLGMQPDGKLGPSALAMLGEPVSGRDSDRVRVDAADGQTEAASTFSERMESAVGAGPVTSLRGDASPQVGLGEALGGVTPTDWICSMYEAHPDVVTRHFFPDADTPRPLTDILSTLGLAPGSTRRLSELATSPGWRAFTSLIASPESRALQHERFRQTRVEPVIEQLQPLGDGLTHGTAVLSILLGRAPDDLSSDAAAQASAMSSLLGADHDRLRPYFEALARGESPERPSPFGTQAQAIQRAMQRFRRDWATAFRTAVSGGAPTVDGPAAGTDSALPLTELPAPTEANARLGDAMIAHTTGTTALQEAYDAMTEHPAGFENRWADYAAQFTTARFLNASATGHRVFVERLARAEAWLAAQGHRDNVRSRVNPSGSASQMRAYEDPNRLSYHHIGLAIDISPATNPWIGEGRAGAHETRASITAVSTWYAAWLMGSGEPMSAVTASQIGYGNRDSGAVHDRFAASSRATESYFALATNRAELQRRIESLGNPPAAPGGFDNVPTLPAGTLIAATTSWQDFAEQSRSATVDAWANMIAAQNAAWRRHVARTDGQFLSLERTLVIALRDIGGLAWGACDFGPNSASGGDFMHFDARTLFSYRAFTAFKDQLRRVAGGSATAPAAGAAPARRRQ